ncbi:putative glutamine/glutamic acid rich protein [Neospora caninum Liverpool]|uniref:Glutamine/glutamic acid rich protein, putative n=1 Tax=Neospora caninum (strain Liverpool) TaxID=572307 RepID=F0VI41_NEOCL|nr:putative glutamine/glutamic acid rich protein [Neospora caninum Liverpool]CBZ53402.1 putative glutamine/glutamic acid rich protein [Neospora caninum Liverpool]CEL67389.1 TPA: glutamine/glutamic acid rich protein, putative [Neospora caninum Liverpool]|eukprot:XP_003883434.1 putative glutamine/glutamic acid rich protein [Neospora caninum Liverpool]
MARKRSGRSKKNASEDQPQTPAAVPEEDQPQTPAAVIADEQPQTPAAVPEEDQPQTPAAVSDEDQPQSAPDSAVEDSSPDAGICELPSAQHGGEALPKKTQANSAAPEVPEEAVSQDEKPLSVAACPRAMSESHDEPAAPEVCGGPGKSPQESLACSQREEAPSTPAAADSVAPTLPEDAAQDAKSDEGRTPVWPSTYVWERMEDGEDRSLESNYCLPQTTFEATLPWTRTEYTCGLCAPSSTFILPTSTPIPADLTRYEGPDCKIITTRTRRYPLNKASFVDQVNVAQDQGSPWTLVQAVASKGFEFAQARGFWNMAKEVRRGWCETGYYPVVEVRSPNKKRLANRVPLIIYHSD